MKNGPIHAAAFIVAILASACSPEVAKAPAPASEFEKALAIMVSDPALTWGPCPPIFSGDCSIAVLHGNPAEANADAFLKVGPQYNIPAHWHTSAERMILVTGQLQVTYKGQPTVTLAVGNYAYGPARMPHNATCVSADPCTLFIAFEAPVDAHAYDGTLE